MITPEGGGEVASAFILKSMCLLLPKIPFYFPVLPFYFPEVPFCFPEVPFYFSKLPFSLKCRLFIYCTRLFQECFFPADYTFSRTTIFQLIVLFLLRSDPCSCFFHSWNYLLTNLCLASYLCSHSSNNFEGFFCWYLIEYLKILKCKNNFCFKTLVPGSNQKVTPT